MRKQSKHLCLCCHTALFFSLCGSIGKRICPTRRRFEKRILITINDSVYDCPQLLFAQRGKQRQRGWQTVLIPGNLRTGKNTIHLSLQADSLAKPEEITTIPFWYVPDK